MPRLLHTVPKYRRHRGSNQAVVTLNGRDHYLGPHGTKASRIEYDRLIGEWLAAGRQPLHISGSELTIAELCVRYWKFAADYYQAHDAKNRNQPAIKRAMKYLRDRYSRTPAVEFGPLALKAVRQQMVDDGLSRRYVNDLVARIKQIFKWAIGEQLLPPETLQALAAVPGLRAGRTQARESQPIPPVGDATIEATLPYLPDVPADMVRVQRLTGMRPAEVCLMRPCDIDRGEDPWRYSPHHHKTQHIGRDRVVCIGPQAQAVLLRYLARDAEAYCFRPCDSEAKRLATVHAARSTPISCGNRPGTNRRRKPMQKPGEVYDVDAYRRAIHRACDRAFPAPAEVASDPVKLAAWQSEHRWSPNQLRHAAATEIRKRFGLEAAQTTLGHARADVTQVYAERDYALAARVAREVG
jgi:integrase